MAYGDRRRRFEQGALRGGALREASKMDPQPRPCFLSVDVHPRARLCSYRMIVIIWGGRPHEQVD